MKKTLASLLILITLPVCSQNWTSWRGDNHTGAIGSGNPPIEFSETQNLKWKTPIPGKGHATPIVWGNQIIVQTAVATDKKPAAGEPDQEGQRMGPPSSGTEFIHQFLVLSVDLQTGKILWQTQVAEEIPLERTHELGSWASNSPVTDGENIYAYFGSRGLHCLDFKGNILWSRDFGQMEKVMSFGEGASPALYQNLVYILWDHEGPSYLYALDKNTGKEVWVAERDEKTSWSTPVVTEVNGRAQIITTATNHITGYDALTGEVIWTSQGLTRNVIPNPIVSEGILYALSGYRGNAVQAIDLAKAKGEIYGTDAILWEYNMDAPYTPCAVLMDGLIYFHRTNHGYLTCLDAKTGEVKYSKEKLEGITDLYSSPTGVSDRIYIASDGIVDVIQAGPTFKLLASNPLEDDFHASPIFIGDLMLLRGFKSLYCFGK